MNNIETLLKNLKNKMLYELQKIMTTNVYESIDLYEFAKKCQYMNQILRDVKNRSKYNRTDDNKIITSNEKIVFANIKTIISTIEMSLFRQITSISTSRFVIASTIFLKQGINNHSDFHKSMLGNVIIAIKGIIYPAIVSIHLSFSHEVLLSKKSSSKILKIKNRKKFFFIQIVVKINDVFNENESIKIFFCELKDNFYEDLKTKSCILKKANQFI